MSDQVDHLDAAYQAVRAHLHERPYDQDPSRLYRDLGSLSQLLGALDDLTLRMDMAAERATGSDDDRHADHMSQIVARLVGLSEALRMAETLTDAAHAHMSHLVFAEERAS